MSRKAIPFTLHIFFLATIFPPLFGQPQTNTDCYDPIIDAIGDLESRRDAKCHATASRLENFMYGTPLTEEARDLRIQKQTQLIREIWSQASRESDPKVESLTRQEINNIADRIITVFTHNNNWYVRTKNSGDLLIEQRDLRQYSSVAYGLRAILAVQQSALFDPSAELKSLDPESIQSLKLACDLASLASLKLADRFSRTRNARNIEEEDIAMAWNEIAYSLDTAGDKQNGKVFKEGTSVSSDYSMIYKSIQQKLLSYQEYNKINQAVFLRNIQSYFAKVLWPKDPVESEEVENIFREALITFAKDLLSFAQSRGIAKEEKYISYETMRESVYAFLPHTVNNFEDVVYYPHLEKAAQVSIEAYDLDAFRDAGVHWQYILYAIEDSSFSKRIEPDPFAAEYCAEAIAQLGVLIWRTAGIISREKKDSHLTANSMNEALSEIIRKIKEDREAANRQAGRESQRIVSSDKEVLTDNSDYFTDVTEKSGVHFEHRSSDWLSRQIRSYLVKKDENLARLAIPPAFGGSGIAAEDINQDGFGDLIILGGLGIHTYLGKGDGSFEDFSEQSGLNWRRPDNSFGETRQVIVADFDNDGIQDVFISYVNDKHRIYRGIGKGKFEDMSEASGLGGEGLVGGPCTSLDYDKDGLLDIYIGYFGNYLQGELPTLARDNTNGSPNKLFKNKGNFVFEDVSAGSGIENTGWTQAVGHTDINNDGWQDIIVGNDFGRNAYYINQKNGKFTDIASEIGTDKPSYTMNVGIADLNRDAYPDFYISNIVVMEKDDKYVLPNEDTKMHFDPKSLATMRIVEANDLFLSVAGNADHPSYELSEAIGRGYATTGWSWDADFFDFDNDGDDDLYCLNGMNDFAVYGTENPYYQSPAGDSARVIFSESAREPNVFFENEGGQLQNVSRGSGLDLLSTSRSASYLDIDEDGDLDIALSNYHGPAHIFENQSNKNGNNWIKVQLECINCPGVSRDAIGARLIVSGENQKSIWREIHSTTGYLSVHPKEQQIGLGHDNSAELKLEWPDGKVDLFHINELNRRYKITRTGQKSVMK